MDKTKEIKELKNRIKEYKESEFVELSLQILESKQSDISLETLAKKIGDEILQENQSRYRTYVSLLVLQYNLSKIAELEDKILFLEGKTPEIDLKIANLKPLFGKDTEKPDVSYEKKIPEHKETALLRQLIDELNKLSEHFYNTCPFIDITNLPNDEDKNSTPKNFFNITRVNDFILTLSDEGKRLRYLKLMKTAYLNDDKRGFIRVRGFKKFTGNKEFLRYVENQISIYEKPKSKTENKIPKYSPYVRKRIIDAAVKLSEKQDRWTQLELIEELQISKSTFVRQKKFFNLTLLMIRDEAKRIIDDKNT